MARTDFTDVVCPGCACVCDDLQVAFDDENRIVDLAPQCHLAEHWFRRHVDANPPAATIHGNPVGMEEALQAAVEILAKAKSPLVYGLSRSATAGQRAAVRLAEQIGAVVDTTASLCHGPSILAMQNVGESTCTLGEVRNRCDLVVFWGCNPAETHPRHAERFSVFPPGMFLPNARNDRTIVMVGPEDEAPHWRLDAEDGQADKLIAIDPNRDFEAITTLRMLVQGLDVSAQPGQPLGADIEQLKRLADLLVSCRSGVVFFGLGLTGTSTEHPSEETLGHANVENLLRLVDELNAKTRFYARRMRLQGDVSGADSVLCWQTGFPFSVNLSRGFPRYNPGEYSANELLSRGEADACLLVGSETVPAFSNAANAQLRDIPTVILEYPGDEPTFEATVRITTSPYGLAAPGTIYRMDETPLPLRQLVSMSWPTDDEVLARIAAGLRS